MDALTFIGKGLKNKPQPFYVLAGEEEFLKRQALAILTPLILGDADPAFALSTFPGDKTDFSTVRNELDTIPFLSPARLVIIEQADKFVTEFRKTLEDYVVAPARTGVLVLDVRTWTSTTKLAKLVPDASTLNCTPLKEAELPNWCIGWCKSKYDKSLKLEAARLLVELVGTALGLLASELEKLAVFVGERPNIERPDIDKLVGRSRETKVWGIMDAVGMGKPAEALDILAELFEQGEDALMILGAMGSQVRKLAKAARLVQLGENFESACDRGGIGKWPAARDAARRQMRHLGQRRLDQLYDWLIEVDLGAKGGSSLPARLLLERLIVRMSRPRE